MGQCCALQSDSSWSSPMQFCPWFFMVWITSRKRLVLPPPQSLEHGVHLVHGLQRQSWGQPCVLQPFVSEGMPAQMAPPKDSTGFFRREREVVPELQDLLQLSQAVHGSQAQSTGQSVSAHAASLVSLPQHSWPPNIARLLVLLCVLYPVPHVLEHDPHSVHVFQ